MEGDHVYDDPAVVRNEVLRQGFLNLLAETLRARFGGLVGRLVRKELEDFTPEGLLTLTLAACADKSLKAKTQDESLLFTHFEELCRFHRGLALGYMHWALWWDGLNDSRKDEIKTRRWQDLQMELQPPTTGQVNYLRRLGHVGPIENMARARRLIEEYIAAQTGRI